MRRVRILDTETTGLEAHDRVVEVAVLTCLTELSVVKAASGGKSTLETPVREVLRPEHHEASLVRPIPWVEVLPEARANHHITDDEIRAAPTVEQVLRTMSCPEETDVTVCHNLDFDERMLRQSGLTALMTKARICTLRCARHVWPELTSHGNQPLRYALELEVRDVGLPPHRALPDIMVTCAILEKLLTKRSLSELLTLSAKVPLQIVCRLPKHRGRPWSAVPPDYLQWILRASPPFSDEIVATAKHWIKERTGR